MMKTQPINTPTFHPVSASVRCYDESVCVTLDGASGKFARRVGGELKSQMVCEDYEVQTRDGVELWLYGLDVRYLCMTGEGIENLLKEIGEECGREICMADNHAPPE